MTGPGTRALRWVAEVTQAAKIVVVRGLREGGSPWLLRVGHRDLVLRVGQPDEAASFATEVAGLRLAARAGIPVPGLLACDEGAAAGGPLVLTGRLPGSSQIPPRSRSVPPASAGRRRREAARRPAGTIG